MTIRTSAIGIERVDCQEPSKAASLLPVAGVNATTEIEPQPNRCGRPRTLVALVRIVHARLLDEEGGIGEENLSKAAKADVLR